MTAPAMASFPSRQEVDFVVVGSGAAGGILARDLSRAGFSVVVLEQGPWRQAGDFRHDELGYIYNREISGGARSEFPQTHRMTEDEEAVVMDNPPPMIYATQVGGSSTHFTANFWRFHPSDFKERSLLGEIAGTGFADWPITYEELEPYYTRVDWEIGVSGTPGPFDPPRSKPYPVPPLPNKSGGVLLKKAADRLGLHAQPAPMAILSKAYDGRPGCVHCGFCMGFGCEVNAKSSTLATMIPQALATGNCELRPLSAVYRLELNQQGRMSEVHYYDAEGNPHAQKARAVILSANGAETARLLLMSATDRHPDGLANGSGKVGKYLMYNGASLTHGLFDEPLNEYKSAQVTQIIHDFYETDPKRGFYGGGGIDARPFLQGSPISFSLMGLAPDTPRWGSEFKRFLAEEFNRSVCFNGHTTSLPMERNNITLDPSAKDKFGRPAMRVTYKDHPDDLAVMRFMAEQSEALMDAAGARRYWSDPVVESTVTAHLLGTCRMGDNPRESVVDRYHRSHEIDNLFICDGSSLVTSGRGQPTMTIQALAFRAAEHIANFARRAEI